MSELREVFVECLGEAAVSRLEQAIDLATGKDSLEREIVDLRQRLRTAAECFRWYERLHLDKPEPDWEKASRNAEMAELCEAGLNDRLPS